MSVLISPAEIRHRFSTLMSAMYQKEVPLYGDLLNLVHEVNDQTLAQSSALTQQLEQTGELPRLNRERHGAIRLGKAQELSTMRRLFAVMGMSPVGYYDLASAGVPVHSTAFRATDMATLNQSPFRVFTSLLRLDLITDPSLREQATAILNQRNIFTENALALIDQAENQGGLNAADAEQFVQEALETFRWHDSATVSHDIYQTLLNQHRLVADVVAFRGPHINHLTPRTLDIDAVQIGMANHNIPPKAIIEGPPRRDCPILLRQTSFKALTESVTFPEENGQAQTGEHKARFGEIEQRGCALTQKGQDLYDTLLAQTRASVGGSPTEDNATEYDETLAKTFEAFPDDYHEMQAQGLAYFHYFTTDKQLSTGTTVTVNDIDALLNNGYVSIEPIVYEDFLPVSAAGIFASNLGDDDKKSYTETANQALFEQALGQPVIDLFSWYETLQQKSIDNCLDTLNRTL